MTLALLMSLHNMFIWVLVSQRKKSLLCEISLPLIWLWLAGDALTWGTITYEFSQNIYMDIYIRPLISTIHQTFISFHQLIYSVLPYFPHFMFFSIVLPGIYLAVSLRCRTGREQVSLCIQRRRTPNPTWYPADTWGPAPCQHPYTPASYGPCCPFFAAKRSF